MNNEQNLGRSLINNNYFGVSHLEFSYSLENFPGDDSEMKFLLFFIFRWQNAMEELLRNVAARGDTEQVVRLLGEGVKNIPDEVRW